MFLAPEQFKKQEPEPLKKYSGAGAVIIFFVLKYVYRLQEDKKHKEIVHFLLLFYSLGRIVRLHSQIFSLTWLIFFAVLN